MKNPLIAVVVIAFIAVLVAIPLTAIYLTDTSVNPPPNGSSNPEPTSTPIINPSDHVRENFIGNMTVAGIPIQDSINFYGNFTSDVAAANGNYTGFAPQVKLQSLDPGTYSSVLNVT
jgi:hypothetical protein